MPQIGIFISVLQVCWCVCMSRWDIGCLYPDVSSRRLWVISLHIPLHSSTSRPHATNTTPTTIHHFNSHSITYHLTFLTLSLNPPSLPKRPPTLSFHRMDLFTRSPIPRAPIDVARNPLRYQLSHSLLNLLFTPHSDCTDCLSPLLSNKYYH